MSARTDWPLGCQARPWLQTLGREGIVERLPEVLRAIATCGLVGFETALNVLPLDRPDDFRAARDAAGGIALSGAHAGGAWWSPESASTIDALLAEVRKLPALGGERLVVTMQPPPAGFDAATIERAVANLRQLGRGCREAGVALAFHDHAAELADDARFIDALVAGCAPDEVALGTDLGWVAYAGVDPAAFVRRYAAHIGYLHIRDLAMLDGQPHFTEVGRGTLDQRAIFGALDAIGYRGWVVAESEFNEKWGGLDELRATATAQFTDLRETLSVWRATR